VRNGTELLNTLDLWVDNPVQDPFAVSLGHNPMVMRDIEISFEKIVLLGSRDERKEPLVERLSIDNQVKHCGLEIIVAIEHCYLHLIIGETAGVYASAILIATGADDELKCMFEAIGLRPSRGRVDAVIYLKPEIKNVVA
jgi:hypothetical protein